MLKLKHKAIRNKNMKKYIGTYPNKQAKSFPQDYRCEQKYQLMSLKSKFFAIESFVSFSKL
jgi:hypothetical protein